MKRLLNSALVVVALLIAATAVLRSHPSATNSSQTASMMSLQEIGAAAGLNKLPVEEFEDQSLVYSAAPKH